MYDVEFSQIAEKQIYKLDIQTQRRVVAALERISVRPYSYVDKLVNNPYFRLRVGEYRVILDIKENKLLVFVVEIGHRKNVYK